MIVNYPVPIEALIVPRGMRKPRGYVFIETVPVEILVADEATAPLVLRYRQSDRHHRPEWPGEEGDPLHTYRVHDGRWFTAWEGGSKTLEEIERDPTVLHLCAGVESVARGCVQRNGLHLTRETSEIVSGRDALPEGRVERPWNFGSDDDGRRKAVVEGASDLLIVEGVVYRPAVEPVLTIHSSHGLSDYHRIEFIDHERRGRDLPVFRLDQLEEAVAETVRRKGGDRDAYVGETPGYDLLRPDLLSVEIDRDAVDKAAKKVLSAMRSKIEDGSEAFFSAFAALRGAYFVMPHPRWSSHLDEAVYAGPVDELEALVVEGARQILVQDTSGHGRRYGIDEDVLKIYAASPRLAEAFRQGISKVVPIDDYMSVPEIDGGDAAALRSFVP